MSSEVSAPRDLSRAFYSEPRPGSIAPNSQCLATPLACVRERREIGARVLPPSMTGTVFSQIARAAVHGDAAAALDAVRMTQREREVIAYIAVGDEQQGDCAAPHHRHRPGEPHVTAVASIRTRGCVVRLNWPPDRSTPAERSTSSFTYSGDR